MSQLAPAPTRISLEEMNGTIQVPPPNAGFWRQCVAFIGPALLVSVGYMDPGNWGTDLQGGALYHFDLLWVVAMASAMAIIFQVLSARLGIVTGKDLAQACHDWYPKWARFPQWILTELAIAACDLAEVLGSAVALNLLFGIPLIWGVLITVLDVLLLLSLQRLGVRKVEAFIFTLVATIGACYFIELFVLPQTSPDLLQVAKAAVTPSLYEPKMVFIALGIIGATVMPHNLYLHSALVQSRKIARHDDKAIATAIKFNTIDTAVALFFAFLINGAIMVLAAMVFFGRESVEVAGGQIVTFGPDTDWIRVAHLTLAPLIGTALASTLFAVALLASGQSSTMTGTLAGQVVMEGFIQLKISPWMRRLITRLIAIIPAVFVIGVRGDGSVTDLLTLSQVVLALQLPFALIPLLHFTSSRSKMGRWRSGPFLLITGWTSALIIVAIDIYGLPESIRSAYEILLAW